MNLAKLTGLCLITIFACSKAASGCSMIHIDPIELPDRTYIFTGRVVDIVGSIDFPEVVGNSGGLVIKPEGIVYVPRTARLFELYIFGTGATCQTTGFSAEALSKAYPIGSRVRVVATKLNSFGGSHNGNIVLAASAEDDISRNDSRARSSASLESVFDYRKHHDRVKRLAKNDERNKLFSLYLQQSHFEFWKDLVRLERVRSREDKIEILERLVYSPLIFDYQGYQGLLKKYVKRRDVIESMSARRVAWIRQLSY